MDINKKYEFLSEKNKARIKKHPFITGFIILILGVFFINLASEPTVSTTPVSSSVKQEQPTQQEQTPSISKEQAQKELNDLMDKSKKAGLVTSYEFSDKASEVFIDNAWYTQTVQFKKKFYC
jgi:hypothetical protein